MSVREEIAEELLRTKSIYAYSGQPFKFTSGRLSPVYVDCRRLISLVDLRNKIIRAAGEIVEKEIGRENVDVVAGGETAGIPYAAFLSHQLGLPMVYVRKEKKGFGGGKQVEGILEKGQRVLLIEDLVADGGSKLNFKEGIEDAGAKMDDCIVVFEYRSKAIGLNEARNTLEKAGIRLFSLADWDVVLEVARKKKYFTDQQIHEVLDFLKEPKGWGKRRGFTDKEI